MMIGRRRFLAISGAAFALALSPSARAAAEWGKDFVPVPRPQVEACQGKVEVLEFFSYACPHCYRLDPVIEAWRKKLPKGVEFHRVPVAFNDATIPLAKAFYAAEALKLGNALHGKLFEAIHERGEHLGDESSLRAWVEKQGVNRQRFGDAYGSFSVQSMVSRANQLAERYDVSSVPSLVVGGKYLTSTAMAGSQEAVPGVLDDLVSLVRQERCGKRSGGR